MKIILTSVLLSLSCSAFACLPDKEKRAEVFNLADTNHDGFIDSTEYKAYFKDAAKIDADKKLNKEEFFGAYWPFDC